MPSFQIMLAELRGQNSRSPIVKRTLPSVSSVLRPPLAFGP